MYDKPNNAAPSSSRIYHIDLVILFLAAGVLQYSGAIATQANSGEVSLGTVDNSVLEGAGPLRYLKDLVVLLFSIYWPVACLQAPLTDRLKAYIGDYFIWLSGLLIIGLIGNLLSQSPLWLIQAGIRWILLLHATFGLCFMIANSSQNPDALSRMLKFVLAVLVVHVFLLLKQYGLAAISLQVQSIAQLRISGLFSNAGVSGSFAIGATAIAACDPSNHLRKRMAIIACALFSAFAAGSRGGVIMCLVLSLSVWTHVLTSHFARLKPVIYLALVPVAGLLLTWGYDSLIAATDRGNMLAQQLEEGGRVYNFVAFLQQVLAAPVPYVLLGAGLGSGTNTGFGLMLMQDLNPEQFLFTKLADNAIVTNFYQFGLIGTLLFWLGIIKFLTQCKRSSHRANRLFIHAAFFVFIVFALTSNPFEQFYLMILLGGAVGLSCQEPVSEKAP